MQPGRGARNVRVDGAPLTGTRALRDGDVARVRSRAARVPRCTPTTLAVRIEWLTTAGDTAPPDLDELAARRARGRHRDHADRVQARTRRRSKRGAARRQQGDDRCRSALGVVLAAVAWFAFTAKSVALDIQPTPVAMSLPDTLLKLQIGRPLLAALGLAPSCRRATRLLPARRADPRSAAPSDQTIALTPTKLPGLITITTEPEVGAEVLLDGMSLGTTPLVDTELTPGVHRLEFGAKRYLAEVRELEVRGGGERQSLAATLTPDWGVVSLRSDPPGATVVVDGTDAGVTPADIDIDSGEHELELRLAGYNAWSNKILVAANQPQQVPDVKLALADGRLELASTPSEASVSVDGEFPRPHAVVAAARAGARAPSHADEARLRDGRPRALGGRGQRPPFADRLWPRSSARSRSRALRRTPRCG